MIQINVSLALNLFDGFTGKPLKPAQVQLFIDGERAKAVTKDGGWWVLCDMAFGTHCIRICGTGFQTEELAVEINGRMQGLRINLKPAPTYRFGRRVTTLTVNLVGKKGEKLAGRTIYALLSGKENELRIAQDEVKAGEKQMRLYTSVGTASLPIPGLFLMGDGREAELVRISGTQDGVMFRMTNPIGRDRKRGCMLRAVAAFSTDEEGRAFLALREGNMARLLLVGVKGALREENVQVEPFAHNEVTLTI